MTWLLTVVLVLNGVTVSMEWRTKDMQECYALNRSIEAQATAKGWEAVGLCEPVVEA